MTGFELVAGVIGIFFVAGIVMGVLVVTVLPRWSGRRYMKGGGWRELPPSRDDDERPPRWPGDGAGGPARLLARTAVPALEISSLQSL